ncbi:MAG: hypothetical protein WCP29_07010 [Acidobacteriota bacterium]
MTQKTFSFACALALIPGMASAQTISGSVALSLARGTYLSDQQTSSNSSFWQEYRLGYSSSLFDPRLVKYNGEVAYRANSLQVGSVTFPQQGRQKDLGYKFGVALFPARPFALSVQASRDTLGESGDYASSNGVRGGIAIPAGQPMPDFQTRNSEFLVGWHLGVAGLPKVDLGYRKGQSLVMGGPYQANQRDLDLHLSASQDTAHTKHTVRFQKTSNDNDFAGAFNQRLTDLDYEFAASMTTRGRASVRVGRRTSFSLFDRPITTADVTGAAYQPPTRGQFASTYAVSTIGYEPSSRVAVELTANLDRLDATQARTDAKLASMTFRYDVFRGFSFHAAGTAGDRGQVIDQTVVKAFTRSGQAGASYHKRIGWFDGGVRYNSGLGASTTVDGRVGASKTWSGDANLSASSRWVTLAGGYDRAASTDTVLAYGNLKLERWRSSVQSQAGRLVFNGSYEQSLVDRGVTTTYSRTRQQMFTGTVSLRVKRDATVSANAGGFKSEMPQSRDRTVFAGVAVESQLTRSLRLRTWSRLGQTTATQTGLNQRSVTGLAQVEYGRRMFTFSAEYRYTDQVLAPGGLPVPIQFRGHQVVLRVTRKFGVRV